MSVGLVVGRRFFERQAVAWLGPLADGVTNSCSVGSIYYADLLR